MHTEQVYKLWKIKTTSSSEILKTIYGHGSYLLLLERNFGRENYKVLKFHRNNFSYFKISAPSSKLHTLNLRI